MKYNLHLWTDQHPLQKNKASASGLDPEAVHDRVQKISEIERYESSPRPDH